MIFAIGDKVVLDLDAPLNERKEDLRYLNQFGIVPDEVYTVIGFDTLDGYKGAQFIYLDANTKRDYVWASDRFKPAPATIDEFRRETEARLRGRCDELTRQRDELLEACRLRELYVEDLKADLAAARRQRDQLVRQLAGHLQTCDRP